MLSPKRTPTFLAALLLVIAGFTPDASASTAALVSDRTGESPSCWWCAPGQVGEFDALLEVSPSLEFAPERLASASRVLRQAELTDNNARALAGFLAVDQVWLGQVVPVVAQRPVEWLGLVRVELRLEARLIAVASGTVLREVAWTAAAHGPTAAAARTAALTMLARDFAALAPSSGPAGGHDATALSGAIPTGADVVVVHSPDGALPFVSFRGALRECHRGLTDVEEIWATEGAVALRLQYDEEADLEDIRRSVRALSGSTAGDALVRSVVEDGETLVVELSRAVALDASPVP